MAHDAPPSFLVLVRLQVTGEGSQEGLNEGLIPLSDPIAPVPLTLGSPWEPEADRGGVLLGGALALGGVAGRGRQAGERGPQGPSSWPSGPQAVGPALALGAVSTRVPGRVCGVGGIEYLPGGPSHSCHVL